MCYIFKRPLSDFNIFHELGPSPTAGKFFGSVTWRDEFGELGGGRALDRRIPLHESLYTDLRVNNSTWVVAIEDGGTFDNVVKLCKESDFLRGGNFLCVGGNTTLAISRFLRQLERAGLRVGHLADCDAGGVLAFKSIR